MQMPFMGGCDATRRIREIEQAAGGADISYISALTANASPEDEEDCRRSGMFDYLSKCAPVSWLGSK